MLRDLEGGSVLSGWILVSDQTCQVLQDSAAAAAAAAAAESHSHSKTTQLDFLPSLTDVTTGDGPLYYFRSQIRSITINITAVY